MNPCPIYIYDCRYMIFIHEEWPLADKGTQLNRHIHLLSFINHD